MIANSTAIKMIIFYGYVASVNICRIYYHNSFASILAHTSNNNVEMHVHVW